MSDDKLTVGGLSKPSPPSKENPMSNDEFVYLLECKNVSWRGRYHHPEGSGTISLQAAILAYGEHRIVCVPWDQW